MIVGVLWKPNGFSVSAYGRGCRSFFLGGGGGG